MSVIPYERHIEPPVVKSPFTRGVTGPGFFGEPKSKPTGDEEEDMDEAPKAQRSNRTIDRPRRSNPTPPQPNVPLPLVPNGHVDTRTPVAGPFAMTQPAPQAYRFSAQNGPLTVTTPAPMQYASHGGPSNRTITAMMGGPQVIDQIAAKEALPLETCEHPSTLRNLLTLVSTAV